MLLHIQFIIFYYLLPLLQLLIRLNNTCLRYLWNITGRHHQLMRLIYLLFLQYQILLYYPLLAYFFYLFQLILCLVILWNSTLFNTHSLIGTLIFFILHKIDFLLNNLPITTPSCRYILQFLYRMIHLLNL